ncbi:MAG: sulfite exporter TauE/SafE family protein [Rhizobiaceae bacterium]
MFDPLALAIIFLTFLLAGLVKGVIGLGLPTVSLAVLAVLFDLPTAMALLIVPSLLTNIWQACIGDHSRALLLRLWPFLTLAAATVWFGGLGLGHFNLAALTALLGLLLIAYAAIGLGGVKLTVNRSAEKWAGPLLGTINGILTGLTGSFVVPGVMYLQSLGLPRDQLVQAMGMLFTVSTLALAATLSSNDLLSTDLAILSTGALIPAIFGMILGQALRKILSESQFRRVFLIALLLLGLYITVQTLL